MRVYRKATKRADGAVVFRLLPRYKPGEVVRITKKKDGKTTIETVPEVEYPIICTGPKGKWVDHVINKWTRGAPYVRLFPDSAGSYYLQDNGKVLTLDPVLDTGPDQ